MLSSIKSMLGICVPSNNEEKEENVLSINDTTPILEFPIQTNQKIVDAHMSRLFIHEFGTYLTKDEINNSYTFSDLLRCFNNKSIKLDKEQVDILNELDCEFLDKTISDEEMNRFLDMNSLTEIKLAIKTSDFTDYKKIFNKYPEVITIIENVCNYKPKINNTDYINYNNNVEIDDTNTSEYSYSKDVYEKPYVDEILKFIEEKNKEVNEYEIKLLETDDNEFVVKIKKLEIHIKYLRKLYTELMLKLTTPSFDNSINYSEELPENLKEWINDKYLKKAFRTNK